jgi:signal recognition particle receptor subunit beta
LGPSGSGKTTLLHNVLFGTSPQTVTSFSENELSGELHKSTNADKRSDRGKKSVFVTLVDLPGVAQWRRLTLLRSATSGAIVVVVDVSEGVKGEVVSAAADLMFDLLTSKSALKFNQPILVVANKAPTESSSSNSSSLEKSLRKGLEEELVRLRSSRGAVAVAGEDDEDKGGVLGSTMDGGFSFDDQECCKSKVTWLTVNNVNNSTNINNKKKLQLDGVKEWISHHVLASS